jgi:uroporphyrinogen-III decarboxylase
LPFYRINIRYPDSDMEKSRRRLEGAYNFDAVDRVPVLLGIEARYLLHERGVTFAEYFSDPRAQLIHQLENFKWRVDNIPDDWFTRPILAVSPDFQNVANASGCGCEVHWQENETPRSIRRIAKIDELDRYQLPDWTATLWGKRVEWHAEMTKKAEETDVRLNGERIPVVVTMGINADSPFMTAVDLAGADFYRWLLEAPDECTMLLEKIADRYIEVETEYRRILDRPMRDGLIYSDDSAQVLSLEQYRRFCVPTAKRLYSTFGCERYDGRTMHLCGRNVHLHPALLHDLNVTMLSGYGPENTPAEMASLAGRVVLHGNIDPMLLHRGTGHDIEQKTIEILEALAPRGGIILGDGYNVVPGTPISNLDALKRTSERYGAPQLRGSVGSALLTTLF